MKKTYLAPEMIAVELELNDILTLSNGTDGIADIWVYGQDI